MLDETVERLEDSDARVWRVGMLPTLSIELHQENLSEAVSQALELGVNDFYVCQDSFEEGVPGIAFRHNGDTGSGMETSPGSATVLRKKQELTKTLRRRLQSGSPLTITLTTSAGSQILK